ncbi:MAG: hypothetical protein B6244_13620 [Candidatus Cloacimonetes bacterium 4572_55]|nr:MAG: hypothetical protein B6244_13620 [Candidatus Cloacimonetes bacterium 4572_55]
MSPPKSPAIARSKDIFLSYSRRNTPLVLKLYDALSANDRSVWYDKYSIPPSADWQAEIQDGIEKAHSFIFVISPDSIMSKECAKELNHALKFKKRIIPIIFQDAEDVPPDISSLNWIFMREEEDFDPGIQSVLDSIDTDLKYNQTHTRLALLALEWERNHYDKGSFLSGGALYEWEQWLVDSEEKIPQPTQLHREFINESRKYESAIQLAEIDRQKRNQIIVTVFLVIALALALFSIGQWRIAVEERSHALEARQAEEAHRKQADQARLIAEEQRQIAQQKQIEAEEARNESEKSRQSEEKQRLQAERLARIATSRQFMAQVTDDLIRDHPQRSILLAIEAIKITDLTGKARSPTAENALRKTLGNISEGSPELLTQIHPKQPATAVTLTKDNRWLVYGTRDSLIYLQRVDQHKQRPIRLRCESPIRSVAVSLNENWLAAGGEDGVLYLWNLERQNSSSRRIPMSWTFTSAINHLVFSSDSRRLAVGGQSARVQLIELNGDGKSPSIHFLSGHKRPISTLTFSSDSRFLLVGSRDNNAYLWDMELRLLSKKSIKLEGHRGPISTVAISPDNHWIATGSYDNTIRLWELNDGHVSFKSKLTAHQSPVNIAAAVTSLTIDDQRLVSGSEDKTIRIWNIDEIDSSVSGSMVGLFGHESWVSLISMSPNGDFFASTGGDKNVLLWKLTKDLPRTPASILSNHDQPITDMEITQDGRFLITAGGSDSTIQLWDVRSILGDSSRSTPPVPESVFQVADGSDQCIEAGQDSRSIVVGTSGGTVIFLNFDESHLSFSTRSFDFHSASITSLDLTPKALATGDSEGEILLWNLLSPQRYPIRLTGHKDQITDLAFIPDGSRLASSSADGSVRMWDVDEVLWEKEKDVLEPVATLLDRHEGAALDLCFNSRGDRLFSAGRDNTVRIWQPNNPSGTAEHQYLK